jgi:5-methylcytosine-specific restriction endonuclease McrA
MNKVFVIDRNKTRLTPCHPARARKLLKNKKAAVYRMRPFTIILKRVVENPVVNEKIECKIDPGSKTSGIVVTITSNNKCDVVYAMNLKHHKDLIVRDLKSRNAVRRNRRNRNTRYREPRFLNRKRSKGWLPPSILSVVNNIVSWVDKLKRIIPIHEIHVEHVNFDTQKMQNTEISGVEYQHGTLAGIEAKQYLLSKYNRECVYCGATHVPLQIEHVIPRCKGGSNRISNLVIACESCNQKKGSQNIEDFLKDKPEILRSVEKGLKTPLKDAATVNSMKDNLILKLENFGLPVFKWSAVITKYNRMIQLYSKDHWIDAACVGESGFKVNINGVTCLNVKSMGRGNRQVQLTDDCGFPRTRGSLKERYKPKKRKRIEGFSTGDLVKVVILKGKYIGNYTSYISSTKYDGQLTFKHKDIKITTNYKNFKLIQYNNGFT